MTALSPERAGFLRRLAAFAVDVLIILTAVTLLGVVLSRLSGGEVRVKSVIFQDASCKTLETLPAGIGLPDGFKPTGIRACTYTFLSIPFNWTVTAEQRVERDISIGGSEYTTSTRLSYVYSLDPSGRPADPLELDAYSVLLYAVYFIGFEWLRGGTLGHLLLRMRVRSVNWADASLMQIVKRFLIRFGWLAVLPVGQWMLLSWPERVTEIVLTFGVLNVAVIAAIGINAFRKMRRGELAWHDRWAHTEMVRTGATA